MPCAVFDRCLSDFAVFVFTGFAVPLSAVWSQPVSGKLMFWFGLVTSSAVFGFHGFIPVYSVWMDTVICSDLHVKPKLVM